MTDNIDYFDSIPSPTKVIIKEEIHEPLSVTFIDGTIYTSDENDTENENDIFDETAITNEIFINSSNNRDDNILNINNSSDSGKITSDKLRNCRKKQKQNAPKTSVKNSESFHSHHGNITESVEFFCTICSEGFPDKNHYDIHQSGHLNNLRCDLCTTVLKNFKNYEKHVAKCKPFECRFCGKIIRFRPNFIKHMRIHNPKNSKGDDHKKIPKSQRHKYKCEVCEKEFTSWEYFKVHKKIHTDDVNLNCGICGKVFSAIACLKSHQKTHSGEKPFRCEVCGKGFGQSYNLKIHFRLHSGEKPFECQICGRKMNTTASYNAHIKTHKDFRCEICNETFNQKIKYMSHMGMHETGKILECNICGKKFGRSSNFYNHQRIHLGIKKFKCYICGHGFVKAANLDSHLMTHCGDNNDAKSTSTNNSTSTNQKKDIELSLSQTSSCNNPPSSRRLSASEQQLSPQQSQIYADFVNPNSVAMSSIGNSPQATNPLSPDPFYDCNQTNLSTPSSQSSSSSLPSSLSLSSPSAIAESTKSRTANDFFSENSVLTFGTI